MPLGPQYAYFKRNKADDLLLKTMRFWFSFRYNGIICKFCVEFGWVGLGEAAIFRRKAAVITLMIDHCSITRTLCNSMACLWNDWFETDYSPLL